MAFRLKLDEFTFFDIAVVSALSLISYIKPADLEKGLTSPDLGAHKAGLVESLDPKAGYDIASKYGNAITSQNQYSAKDEDNPDKEVNIEFHVSAQPAQEMLIVITQVRL